jgi:hypothetical protein
MKDELAVKIRKNQNTLTAKEWDNFICAFKEIKEGLFKGVEKPTMDDFADEHALAFGKKLHEWQAHGHSHGAGSEGEHTGVMFLAWHRIFLSEFEKRLRRQKSNVTIPYWNALKHPFPEELKKITDNEGERVDMSGVELPDFTETDFFEFQRGLELGYHNVVHAALRGTVSHAHAPRDAAFWLHHAMVDRQWEHWFEKQNGTTPANMDSTILGDEIVKGKKVRDVLHTTQLDYVYDNGIYNNVESKGSESFRITLEEKMILCVKLNSDWYAKMQVYYLSDFTPSIVMQHFPYLKPGSKHGLFPSETMYVNLETCKLNVPANEAHVRFIKKTSTSGSTYRVEAVNGTRMSEFTALTDFTANNGQGATDYEMLYI